MDALGYAFEMLIGVCLIQAIVVVGLGRVRARSGQPSPETVPSVLCAGVAIAAYVSPTTLLLTLAGALLALTLVVALVGGSHRWHRPGKGRVG